MSFPNGAKKVKRIFHRRRVATRYSVVLLTGR